MDEDAIRRAVAEGMRDYERSRPKPKGVVDEVSGAACGCVAMITVALFIGGLLAAYSR